MPVAVAEGVGGAAAPAAAAAPGAKALKPPASAKLFYCFGQVVESGYLTVNTFVFFYYTAVLGMSGSMVGLALAISLVLDAIADPLIGSWSDGVRSRFGRRLPVMLIGAPLTFLTMGLLFSPPSGVSVYLLFFWLTFFKMAVRAFASVFNIPFFALGGEMSDDYAERTRIVAWRLLAGIVTSLIVYRLGYGVFFAGEGGLQRPERYPAFGWTVAGFVLTGALICIAGLWRYASALPQPAQKVGAMFTRLPAELAEVLRNRSFLILSGALLLFASAAGLHATLQSHTYVFVWKLRPEVIQYLSYIYLFGILVATPGTPLLMRWMEKKTACMIGFATVMAAWIVLPGLRAAGLFAPTGEAAFAWLLPTQFVVGVGSGMIFVALPAMMADAADEHDYLFGARREGLYFSGLAFAGKAAGGVGTLAGGLMLDLIRFPQDAGRQVNAVLDESVLAGLALGWGPLSAALTFIGAIIFLPYGVSRARQAQIAEALRARREGAAVVSAGHSS
jgi:glycoside/pentoside/hexuronide:cation symporter, GPH family